MYSGKKRYMHLWAATEAKNVRCVGIWTIQADALSGQRTIQADALSGQRQRREGMTTLRRFNVRMTAQQKRRYKDSAGQRQEQLTFS